MIWYATYAASLATLAGLAVRALLYAFRAEGRSAADRLDALFAAGWCATRELPLGTPADGWHVGWLAGHVAIGHRATGERDRGNTAPVAWTIYTRAPAAAVAAAMAGDGVAVGYFTASGEFRTMTTRVDVRPLGPPRAWQAAAAQDIADVFAARGTACGLFAGPPGVGKSSLGEYVARELGGRLGCRPLVVYGFSLAARFARLDDLPRATAAAPLVLVLDEFDESAARAEAGGPPGDKGWTYADTAAGLLGALDRLARTPHVVVVATSNVPLAAWRGKFARYVRPGRFDLLREVGA